jgi:cytochrome c biogenesis protein CcmG, thiol:disulfide interchange protein DsbE
MSTRFIKRKAIIALMAIVFFLPYGCAEGGPKGDLAPNFQLRDLTGNKVSLDEIRGNIVILDFWATWCPPCRMSIPELVDLQKRYKEKGVIILGISMDDPDGVTNNDLIAFSEKNNINYHILRADPKILMDYFGGASISIPTMFLVDRQGKIAAKHVGFVAGSVERSLKNLL